MSPNTQQPKTIKQRQREALEAAVGTAEKPPGAETEFQTKKAIILGTQPTHLLKKNRYNMIKRICENIEQRRKKELESSRPLNCDLHWGDEDPDHDDDNNYILSPDPGHLFSAPFNGGGEDGRPKRNLTKYHKHLK